MVLSSRAVSTDRTSPELLGLERLLLTLIVLILVGGGAALADLPGLEAHLYDVDAPLAAEASQVADGWRRTARGWEHVSTWQLDAPQTTPPSAVLHPLTLALAQGLISLAALLWWDPARNPTQRAESSLGNSPSPALTQQLLF